LSYSANEIEQPSGPESSQLKNTVDHSFFELLLTPPSDEEKLAFFTSKRLSVNWMAAGSRLQVQVMDFFFFFKHALCS